MVFLRSADKTAREAQLAAQADLRQQAKIAKEAHEKYERELVAHAEDVKRLTEIKEELEGVRASTAEHVSAAEVAKSVLAGSEASWSRQKTILEQEVVDLRKRSVVLPSKLFDCPLTTDEQMRRPQQSELSPPRTPRNFRKASRSNPIHDDHRPGHGLDRRAISIISRVDGAASRSHSIPSSREGDCRLATRIQQARGCSTTTATRIRQQESRGDSTSSQRGAFCVSLFRR